MKNSNFFFKKVLESFSNICFGYIEKSWNISSSEWYYQTLLDFLILEIDPDFNLLENLQIVLIEQIMKDNNARYSRISFNYNSSRNNFYFLLILLSLSIKIRKIISLFLKSASYIISDCKSFLFESKLNIIQWKYSNNIYRDITKVENQIEENHFFTDYSYSRS